MFSKSDLEISKKFNLPFQPYAPKDVQDAYWSDYSKYLDSLSEIDSVRMDYKNIKISLLISIVIIFISLLCFLFIDDHMSAGMFLGLCFLGFISIPFIIYEFFKTKNNLRKLLKKS